MHPVQATSIATAVRHVLPNGLVVLIQRNPHTPTVSIRGDVGVGTVHETAAHSGLAAFTGAALIRGTERRSFQEIASETEARGCSVSAGGGLHTTSFGGKALTEDLPLVLELLYDMLTAPTFPAPEIEKLRGQAMMSLREQEQETGTQASRAVRALLYPPAHPYSRLGNGTQETIAALTRADLVAFRQRYHPALTRLAVVGDVEPDDLIARLEEVFGGWEPGPLPTLPTLPEAPPLASGHRRDVFVPGKEQADVIWAVPGMARNNADYYAATVANMVLGRLGNGGRLGDNIRERQGMAYYAHSGLAADLGAGPWAAIAGVNPLNIERVIDAMIDEIRHFCAHGPTEQELADVRAYLTGSLVLGLETNGGIASTLLYIERHGLGLDYITRYAELIRSVTHEQVVAVARAYLDTDNFAVAVAGPALAPPTT